MITPMVERPGLRARLQAIVDDIDALWPDALESGNLDRITRVVDASHGAHRALLALGDDSSLIGMRSSELASAGS